MIGKAKKDKVLLLRVSEQDRTVLAQLAAQMGVKQSEAVRRAVLMAAQGMHQVQQPAQQ